MAVISLLGAAAPSHAAPVAAPGHVVAAVPAVATPPVTRLAGPSRYATAVAVSQEAFSTGQRPPVVLLVSGANYPDALTAAPAAARLGGITLLTEPSRLTPVTEAELRRLAPEKVVILGAAGAVSAEVEAAVAGIAPVERIGGADRFETSRLVAAHVFGGAGSSRAWIATGLNYPDALAAGAAAGANGAPLVLVDGSADAMDDATAALVVSLGATEFVIAGGPTVVSAGLEQSLAARVPGAGVYRAGGTDRFDTARLVVAHGFPGLPPGRAFLATGSNYPDALVGAAYAARLGRPLLLTRPLCIDPSIRPVLLGPEYTSLTLLGGASVLRGLVGTLEPCQSLSSSASAWVVVNKQRPYEPSGYTPSGLVTPNVRYAGGQLLRAEAATAVQAMFDDAGSAGVPMSIVSGYRSFATQAALYDTRLRERGRSYTDAWIARPGHSEHQSGLALDIGPVGAAGCSTHTCLGNTPQGRWLAENSWRYGFIVRYQAGQETVTGYNAEPWHVRYVGVPLATDYHRDGWTSLEDYAGLPAAPTY